MVTISWEGTFDSAHVLSFYDGKCGNLHGHTYRVKVVLQGEADAGTGMLVDFNLLKKCIDQFDHAVIFAGEEARDNFEKGLYNLVMDYGMRYEVMPVAMKPTAENIVRVIAERIKRLSTNIRSCAVQLWETPKSFAEIEL